MSEILIVWEYFAYLKDRLLSKYYLFGKVDVIEWQRFIKDAKEAEMMAMADSMQDRLDNYLKEV